MKNENEKYLIPKGLLNSLPNELGDLYKTILSEVQEREYNSEQNLEERIKRAVSLLENDRAIDVVDFMDLISKIWVYGLNMPHIFIKYNKFLIDSTREGNKGLDGAWYPDGWIRTKKKNNLRDRRYRLSEIQKRNISIFSAYIAIKRLKIQGYVKIILASNKMTGVESGEDPSKRNPFGGADEGTIRNTVKKYRKKYPDLIPE